MQTSTSLLRAQASLSETACINYILLSASDIQHVSGNAGGLNGLDAKGRQTREVFQGQ